MSLDFSEQSGKREQGEEDEAAVARRVSRNFLEEHGWLKRTYDLDDLEQECREQWHLARHTYQEGKGASWKTYMERVMRNKLVSILKDQLAKKRTTDRLAISLDQPISGEQLSMKESIPAVGFGDADPLFLFELDRAMARLNSSQRELCALLYLGYNITDIATIMHKPRGTLYDDLARIRKVFTDEGLDHYMT
uniref:RNA polymerase sigma70 n=1 Tax=bacterium enrichment culture clone fosmid MGS-K1 TaxID=1549356 RepID=A0A0B5KNR7_9BACT|nr:RNA polymerase sigma70 [bacterium enrichment culture clone fosmid MGS-K1]